MEAGVNVKNMQYVKRMKMRQWWTQDVVCCAVFYFARVIVQFSKCLRLCVCICTGRMLCRAFFLRGFLFFLCIRCFFYCLHSLICSFASVSLSTSLLFERQLSVCSRSRTDYLVYLVFARINLITLVA